RCPRYSVHPHACGEQTVILHVKTHELGSSPRMWGTADFNEIARTGYRFIPTHVGNSSVTTCRTDRYTVHPHACGEQVPKNSGLSLIAGSSPRMWGTVPLSINSSASSRFIPTHV